MFLFCSKQLSVKYQTNDLFVKTLSDILNKNTCQIDLLFKFFSKILQSISKKSQSVSNSVRKKKAIKSLEKNDYVSA